MKQKTAFDSLTKFGATDAVKRKARRGTKSHGLSRRSFITLATLALIAPSEWDASLLCAYAKHQPQSNAARTLFRQAAQLAQVGRSTEALNALRRSFAANFPTPEDVLKEDVFQSLLRNPIQRQQLRRLLREFAKQSFVMMVTAGEPGSRLTIRGVLRDTQTARPVPGATVFLYHTDNEGLYAPEQPRAGAGSENPRLFCYVKSDAGGRFEIHTIRPASYPGINNMRHVHFEIEAQGYGLINSQFYINGDPSADEQRRRIAAERDWPIVDPVRADDGHLACDVVLKLRPAGR